MFKKLSIFLLLAVSSFFLVGSVLAATNLSLYPLKISVKKGQTVRVSISANPHGVMNYTVKSSLKFPADILSLKSWAYGNDWMPVKKTGYDSFSNTAGTLVRTAGYPNGFNKTTNFGSATFVAKKSGTGIIEFASDNLILGADNSNLYGGGNKVSVVVSDPEKVNVAVSNKTTNKPVPTNVTTNVPANVSTTTAVAKKTVSNVKTEPSEPTPVDINPPLGDQALEQAHDIVMEIGSYDLERGNDLSAKVTMTGFGETPAPVYLIFDIIDANNKIVYTESDNVVINTDGVFNKKFSNLPLSAGKYILKLNASYEGSVLNQYQQPFAVKAVASSSSSEFNWIIITICSLIVIGLIMWLIFRRRKK